MGNKELLSRTNEILDFIKKGEVINDISINDEMSFIREKLGPADHIIGDSDSGYLQYDSGLRVGYNGEEVTEIAIMIYGNKKLKFPIRIDELDDIKYISEKIKIHEFIKVLAYSDIKWRSFSEHSKMGFTLRAGNDVLILFDLDDGKIDRIVYLKAKLDNYNR